MLHEDKKVEGKLLKRRGGLSPIQTAARSLTAESGGSHSGKKGLTAYMEKVRATMAIVAGLTTMHSTHKRMNAKNLPKVIMM